jgi:pilus assembly protein CpaE
MPGKILVIDDDVDTLRLVGLMLQRQGYQVSAAANGSQGLARAFEERPDLILLDVMMPDMDGYEVTRRLRGNPDTVSIPILMFTAKTQLDDRVIGYESGADDYLTKPTHPTELQAHVKALLARASQKRGKSEAALLPEQGAYKVGVLSPRAGLGVSTVAANLSAALNSRSQADVILAELTPGQGTLAADLGLPAQSGLAQILSGVAADVTLEKVTSSLVAHGMGLKILAASDNPRDVDLSARVENYEALVSTLATLARFLILDLGSGLPAFAQMLLSKCDERIIVMEGTPHSIKQTRLLLNEYGALGIDPATVSIVLNNRFRSDAHIALGAAQEQLGHPIACILTPVPEVFQQAFRLHTPVVIAQPANTVSNQFFKIADDILQRQKAR